MTDGNETFESTKARLEEILGQVRKKDTSLEQSLELLEEGVRLANRCNELIDQTSWRPETDDDATGHAIVGDDVAPADGDATAGDVTADGDATAGDVTADNDATAGDGPADAAPHGDEPYIDDERT